MPCAAVSRLRPRRARPAIAVTLAPVPDRPIIVAGEALIDLVAADRRSARRASRRRPVQHGAHARPPRPPRDLPRARVHGPLRRAARRTARGGPRRARRRRADGGAHDARPRRARPGRQRPLPLLLRGHVGAGADRGRRDHGAAGGRGDRARRHARAGVRADGRRARGGRGALLRPGARDGRPELPADGALRRRELPRPAPPRVRGHARGQGVRGGPRLAVARHRRRGRGARAARAGPGGGAPDPWR